MDILKVLTGLMGSNQGQGQDDQGMIGNIAKAAIPMIMMGLFNNAQSNKGAESLMNALGSHEKNNDSEDLFSRVKGSNTQDGIKILKHIFGKDTENIANQIADRAGVSQNQAQDAMGSLAPIILETLANKTKSSRNVDNIRSSLAEELLKVDNEPSTPDLPDIFKQVLSGVQGDQKSGGIGGLLSGILGGGDKKESAGLMDMLGGTEGLGNILKKML